MSGPLSAYFSITSKGTALRLVLCKGCGTDFIYALEATVTLDMQAPLLRKRREARAHLARIGDEALRTGLERGVAAVPCPVCGLYQPNMLPLVRRACRRWMINVGAACLIVALVAYITSVGAQGSIGGEARRIESLAFATAIALGIVGAGLLAGRAHLVSRFDPNGGAADRRIALGRSKAILRSDLEEQLAKARQAVTAEQHALRHTAPPMSPDPTSGELQRPHLYNH